jgi:uncharacterized phage protein (TIGR01671 family)
MNHTEQTRREIKFRAWNGKEMISVDVLDMEGKRAADYYNWYDGYAGEWIDYESDYKILMQYTGLKDKNGVEIYEGDIIEVMVKGKQERYEVKFNRGCFVLQRVGGAWSDVILSEGCGEVISNIYQNPERLK